MSIRKFIAIFVISCLTWNETAQAIEYPNQNYATFNPLTTQALFQEQPLLQALTQMHKPVLKAGRFAAFALFLSLMTLSFLGSASAQIPQQSPPISHGSFRETADLLKPLTREHYELFRANRSWGRHFANISYEDYLNERKTLGAEQLILDQTLQRWRTEGSYGGRIWQMLTKHPHPIVITRHLPEGFGGALDLPLGVLLLDAALFSSSDTADPKRELEYKLAYYMGHELLHEEYPHETETHIHARTVDLVMSIRNYHGWTYSRMRYVVQEALEGDPNAVSILEFKLQGNDLEEAKNHVLGIIDPVIAAVEKATGIPRARITFDGIFKMSEEDIQARDEALQRSGQSFSRKTEAGVFVEADGSRYWVWLGDGKHQVLLDPSDHEHADPSPLVEEPAPVLDNHTSRLALEILSEATESLGSLRRAISWMLQTDPFWLSSITSVIDTVAVQKGWTDETLLAVILRKDTADHWTIEKLEPAQQLEKKLDSAPHLRPNRQPWEKRLRQWILRPWDRFIGTTLRRRAATLEAA